MCLAENNIKKDRIKLIVSPADCTGGSTSVIDEHIGRALKIKYRQHVQNLRENDPTMAEKTENDGVSCLRVQVTKWIADSWEEIQQSHLIPSAFKKCGLCNYKNGRENHLVKCQALLTYKPPQKNDVRRAQPTPNKN